MEAMEKSKNTLMPMRSDERLAQKIATDVLSRYPVARMLDIGCGDGVVSQHIPKTTSYLGLDINEACIYEQNHNNPLVRYVRANDIPQIMREQGPWEMVILFDVLEHTSDFTGLFEMALECSNKYIAVSLPNELFFLDRLKMLLGKEHNAHSLDLVAKPEGFKHQYVINIEKARALLEAKTKGSGFELKEEVTRPLLPKNRLYAPIMRLMSKVTSEQLWSQGSIFIYEKCGS